MRWICSCTSEMEQQYLVTTQKSHPKKSKGMCSHLRQMCLEQVPESAPVCEIYFCTAVGHISTWTSCSLCFIPTTAGEAAEMAAMCQPPCQQMKTSNKYDWKGKGYTSHLGFLFRAKRTWLVWHIWCGNCNKIFTCFISSLHKIIRSLKPH